MTDDIPKLLGSAGYTLCVAESLTGGLLSDTFAKMPDASEWFKGGIVAYSEEVKRRLLDIADAPVVSKAAAIAMADHAATLLGADVAVAATGVGGPGAEDGVAAGTVWIALRLPTHTVAALRHFPGSPTHVVHHTCRAVIDALGDALAAVRV